MVEAVETLPGTDPDRASFTIALETAKDQLISAADVLPEAGPGHIASALLHDLLPPRRARVNPRRVKCPVSRYAAPPDQAQVLGASRITSIKVTVHSSATPGPDGRRDRTLQLLRTAPLRTWRACEIARGIGLDDAQGLRAELGRWVREGILRRTGRGVYTLEPAWIAPDLHHPSTPPS
jgi:hypothetical protein